MAVAGLHNVSVFDSSFLRESGPPESRQWSDQDRTGTRASSLLQLWRGIEGEHVVNHSNARAGGERSQQQRNDRTNPDSESVNGSDNLELNDVRNESSGTCSRSHAGVENEQEDCNSITSEQSVDLGEVERQRVRKIFREWMKSAKNHSLSSRSTQQLNENVHNRGSVQRKGSRGSSSDEAGSEDGSQIDVLDGSIVGNHCEIGERRTIRKLCGRQALLDLLAKAQRERKRELQELLEHKRVSNFSHRNRIQVNHLSASQFKSFQTLIFWLKVFYSGKYLQICITKMILLGGREGVSLNFTAATQLLRVLTMWDCSGFIERPVLEK